MCESRSSTPSRTSTSPAMTTTSLTSHSHNIRVAMLMLGVTVRYDRFADRVLIDGLADFGPVLEDAAITRLLLTMDQQLQFRPKVGDLVMVVDDTARLNGLPPRPGLPR